MPMQLPNRLSLQGKMEPNDFSDSSHRPERGGMGLAAEAGTAASPPLGQPEAVSPKRDAEAEVIFSPR
jgi:hypothetical protein